MEMSKFEEITEYLKEVTQEINYYKYKPTKTSSALIRKELGAIKNLVTEVRRELVAADKIGY